MQERQLFNLQQDILIYDLNKNHHLVKLIPTRLLTTRITCVSLRAICMVRCSL